MNAEEITDTIREIIPEVRELRALPLWSYEKVLMHLRARLLQRDPNTLATMSAIMLMMLSDDSETRQRETR